MKIKVDEKNLQSTAYRRLFECAKEEGIDELLNLVYRMSALQNKNIVEESVLEGKNELLKLTREHKSVITYLRTYRKDFDKSGFKIITPQIYYLLKELSENITLLEKYLENARILEELKVNRIELINNDIEYFNKISELLFFKNTDGQITDIIKFYTDGYVNGITPELQDKYSDGYKIYFDITSKTIIKDRIIEIPPTWLLKAENHANGYQFRYFYTTRFDFNPSELPTEEELSSYEIPAFLKLKK